MKLKNLFLVSLAAMAMASCSNENDPVDNSGNAVADAKMLFSFAMPGATITRATGDTEVGTNEENAVQTVNVRVVYSNNASSVFNFIAANDFDYSPETKIYTLKEERNMMVAADESATIYVTVNGDDNVTPNGTMSATYDVATASIITGLAAGNNFLMTGSKDGVRIIKGAINNADVIPVSRVAARIDEVTNITSMPNTFTFNTVYTQDGTTISSQEEELTATIEGYALCNLNQVTNIFQLAAMAAGATYFQPLTLDGDNSENYEDLVSRIIGSTHTYCLENEAEANPTYVIYKVSYQYAGSAEKAPTFYKFQNKLYKDFETLDKDNQSIFSGQNLSPSSAYDEFIEVGVQKYSEGYAYYTKAIMTNNNTEKIVRNNVYKLNVTGISGLGDAVIDTKTDGELTWLRLEVQVADWIVQENSIEL